MSAPQPAVPPYVGAEHLLGEMMNKNECVAWRS